MQFQFRRSHADVPFHVPCASVLQFVCWWGQELFFKTVLLSIPGCSWTYGSLSAFISQLLGFWACIITPRVTICSPSWPELPVYNSLAGLPHRDALVPCFHHLAFLLLHAFQPFSDLFLLADALVLFPFGVNSTLFSWLLSILESHGSYVDSLFWQPPSSSPFSWSIIHPSVSLSLSPPASLFFSFPLSLPPSLPLFVSFFLLEIGSHSTGLSM